MQDVVWVFNSLHFGGGRGGVVAGISNHFCQYVGSIGQTGADSQDSIQTIVNSWRGQRVHSCDSGTKFCFRNWYVSFTAAARLQKKKKKKEKKAVVLAHHTATDGVSWTGSCAFLQIARRRREYQTRQTNNHLCQKLITAELKPRLRPLSGRGERPSHFWGLLKWGASRDRALSRALIRLIKDETLIVNMQTDRWVSRNQRGKEPGRLTPSRKYPAIGAFWGRFHK